MFRKYALSILITLALPVAVQAGGGGVPSEAVAPVLGSNGASAVVLAESAGGSATRGSPPAGERKPPTLPATGSPTRVGDDTSGG